VAFARALAVALALAAFAPAPPHEGSAAESTIAAKRSPLSASLRMGASMPGSGG
jgi:hypothetical protein